MAPYLNGLTHSELQNNDLTSKLHTSTNGS